jgi:glycine cleavage system H protein
MHAADLVDVAGFSLALDRYYQRDTHMWVLVCEEGRVRIGMDAVGVETSGTLAQLSFEPVGTELVAGRPFGQLEAAKFVGPLISPVSGTLLEGNAQALLDAGTLERDPYGQGWLIEVAALDNGVLLDLLADPDETRTWFAGKIADYRAAGVIAQ